MLELILAVGNSVREHVLGVAALLKNPASPGLVTLALISVLVAAILQFGLTVKRRRSALNRAQEIISSATDAKTFSSSISRFDAQIRALAGSSEQRHVRAAWSKYRETLVLHEEEHETILRNAVRPATFFNLEDLGFGAGFWRIVPGLFVSVGLFLTFLGLISALTSLDLTTPDQVQTSLRELLTIASAKFIMSLTGLLCSIVFTIALRIGLGRVDQAIHQLCGKIEQCLTYISLEALAAEQLAATREQREHFRHIGLELVAELGRPLREDLPLAISTSIASAMSPILQQVGQAGADGMGSMVKDLSSRFSDDVGRALSDASAKLAEAGERIGHLSERMDQSSGRMGSEMDSAVTRLSQAIEDLRNSMGSTAETASGALTKGADHLLSVMNQTLEGIRDNTGEGARAISAAAFEMRGAAEIFRTEIEQASRSGSEAVNARLQNAGDDASNAIGTAGRGMIEVFGQTSGELARVASDLSEKAARDLFEPLDRISEKFSVILDGLADGTTNLRRLSDGMRAGAEASETAAGNFRSASNDFVQAATPMRAIHERIEAAIRQLSTSTQTVAETLSRSAETTARSAADTLASASQVLGGEARAIESALSGVATVLERMKGQGDRLDEMDEKLGRAFEIYNERVAAAVEGMFDHVRRMQAELSPALDTLQSVVEQAEQFAPESRRR
ncbi:hypothetical protein ASF65_06000 [Aureimonas sp. Leaf324]|nr:hypothetical protein ASF65_06000 [Aureimonas sp. Leaf324]